MVKKLLIAIIICLLAIHFLHAGEKATPGDAKKVLGKAGACVKANDKENDGDLREFNKPRGKFVKGELYDFAYDLDGIITESCKSQFGRPGPA